MNRYLKKCIYIYLYRERETEREREKDRGMCVYMYRYKYTFQINLNTNKNININSPGHGPIGVQGGSKLSPRAFQLNLCRDFQPSHHKRLRIYGKNWRAFTWTGWACRPGLSRGTDSARVLDLGHVDALVRLDVHTLVMCWFV